MVPSFSRRILALALSLGTAALASAAPIAGAEQAILSGRVLHADGITPRNGVVVALLDVDTQQTFRSQPTGDEGAFHIDSAPAGSYQLAAETSEGAFLANAALELQAGANPPLALTLAPGVPNPVLAPANGSGSGDGEHGVWEWVVAGLIFVAALWAIDDSSENVEETASSF